VLQVETHETAAGQIRVEHGRDTWIVEGADPFTGRHDAKRILAEIEERLAGSDAVRS
jgi:hypothetical protein